MEILVTMALTTALSTAPCFTIANLLDEGVMSVYGRCKKADGREIATGEGSS